MAKNKENTGLFGANNVVGLAEEAKRNIERNQAAQLHNKVTQQNYTIQHEELRNKRIQIVVKPSVSDALERLVKQKKIKSKNDLVNFLLESYLEQNKE